MNTGSKVVTAQRCDRDSGIKWALRFTVSAELPYEALCKHLGKLKKGNFKLLPWPKQNSVNRVTTSCPSYSMQVCCGKGERFVFLWKDVSALTAMWSEAQTEDFTNGKPCTEKKKIKPGRQFELFPKGNNCFAKMPYWTEYNWPYWCTSEEISIQNTQVNNSLNTVYWH